MRTDSAHHHRARDLPGFVRVETLHAPQAGTVNAIYYFTDMESVRQLARFPAHREAKGQVQRWHDGCRIIISEAKAHTATTDCPPTTDNASSRPYEMV